MRIFGFDFSTGSEFRRRQRAAGEDRYYGSDGTIHGAGVIDVEVHNGKVVAVWYRCQHLPFKECVIDDGRALEMSYAYDKRPPAITGIILSRD